jgi:hypothetical protein
MIDRLLGGDGKEFESFDFTLEGDFGLPRRTSTFFEINHTFFLGKPNRINCLPSNRVLDRKPDRVTGYKVLIDLTSLISILKLTEAYRNKSTKKKCMINLKEG